MRKKQLLELTWVGKNNQPRLEPRILIEDHTCSCRADRSVSDPDIFDNRLIFGDNLLALKALEQEFTGQIKCIYIDPPFNTKQAFDHYEDGVEHSIWLNLMRNRIEMLHRLLSEDGSFFVHIDDNELGYLIALTDEIFGRANRVSVITFKQSSASGPKAINPGYRNHQ
jgi:adenine-specific DNA-methyltransferase